MVETFQVKMIVVVIVFVVFIHGEMKNNDKRNRENLLLVSARALGPLSL